MKSFLINLIKFYQKNISKLKKPCCRYTPNCSDYAIVAIERFGIFRGGLMSFLRVLRCNPFFKGGYDPVPEKTEKNSRRD